MIPSSKRNKSIDITKHAFEHFLQRYYGIYSAEQVTVLYKNAVRKGVCFRDFEDNRKWYIIASTRDIPHLETSSDIPSHITIIALEKPKFFLIITCYNSHRVEKSIYKHVKTNNIEVKNGSS